ncbi:hypothetical protein KPL74_09225 [Bacillus sp. NP157]|nr:hypothetical protein KPL74_09225 [Bacillus sp. NP157]
MSAIKRQSSHEGVQAFLGTPQDVGASIASARDAEVIGFAIPRTAPNAAAIQETLKRLLPFVDELVNARQAADWKRLVEALTPNGFAQPEYAVHLMKMQASVQKTLLESGDFITAVELAELAGLSTRNPGAQPNKWKASRRIFAIHRNNVDYFPIYALDASQGFRPYEVMGKILALFDDRKDAWKIAAWFASANGFLGSRRPQDLLATAPDQVLAAAKDEVEDVVHA